jgi:hypothetical protein
MTDGRRARRQPRQRAVERLLAISFAVISAMLLAGTGLRENGPWLGWDAVLSTHAARDLLAGGDPWTSNLFGIVFTGPPTGLLPFLPFVALPDALVAGVWVAIGIASAIYSVRALALPASWLLFPPLFMGIASGSSAPLVLALLVRAGVTDDVRGIVANAAAILARPYAAVPTLLLGRWRAAALAFDVALVTVPILAWSAFVPQLPAIWQASSTQANGGLSAAISPGMFLITAVGLIVLGRRRAAWLIVPALLPDAQLAYASIALPVLAEMPIVALALASPATPGLVGFGIAAQCGAEWVKARQLRRSVARRWAPDELLARRERKARPATSATPASVKRG